MPARGQAVIASSALSLLYPHDALPGYSRAQLLADLVPEAANGIRSLLDAGAVSVLEAPEFIAPERLGTTVVASRPSPMTRRPHPT